MSRRLLVLTILLFAGACKTAPISYFAVTPQPAADAYTCALRKINELGYTISNTNKEAGFITGDKQTSGLGTRLLSGSQYTSVLTVSIFDAPSTVGRRMRVTAAQVRERSNLFTTSKNAEKPSDVGISDAKTVLEACTEGGITRQASAVFSAEAIVRQGI